MVCISYSSDQQYGPLRYLLLRRRRRRVRPSTIAGRTVAAGRRTADRWSAESPTRWPGVAGTTVAAEAAAGVPRRTETEPRWRPRTGACPAGGSTPPRRHCSQAGLSGGSRLEIQTGTSINRQ